MSSASMASKVIALSEVQAFMQRCMVSLGTDKQHALQLAEVLAAGDYRGHFSHGLNRLDIYIRDIQSGICKKSGEPAILKETAATAYVDGNNLLGPVVGNFCMKLAIEKAKTAGIGWVVAKGSNHYGIAGWYSMQALKEGFVGMSFTNTSPILATTRGKKAFLGTNPLSVSAPGRDGDSFVLDMASTAVALGKVEMQDRKDEPIPSGWGINKDGQVTANPKEVLDGGALLPLGGVEETSGYKGYGLAMMVEIFCGILGGTLYGPNIRKWMLTTAPANLAQCFVAINPEAFAPGFEDRMSDLMELCRNQTPVDESKPVLVAGDPERMHMAKCDEEGGIRYHINQITHANEIASELGVPPPKTVE